MLAVALVFASTAAAAYVPLAKPTHDELMAELTTSDVVFLGRVVAVDHYREMCAQSGFAIVYQSVTYELERVLMGVDDHQSVVVGHALWAGGAGQDSATGCLAPELFAVGSRLLILGKRHKRVRDFDLVTNGDSPDVLVPTRDLVATIEAAVKDCTVVPGRDDPVNLLNDLPDRQLGIGGRNSGSPGVMLDLRDDRGHGLAFGQRYLDGVRGSPGTRVEQAVASPSDTRVAVELGDGEGNHFTTLVGFVGKMCPPRLLTARNIRAENDWPETSSEAKSPVWVSDDTLAFLLGTKTPGPWVYLRHIPSGAGRAIRVSAPAIGLAVRSGRLTCVTADDEIRVGAPAVESLEPTVLAP